MIINLKKITYRFAINLTKYFKIQTYFISQKPKSLQNNFVNKIFINIYNILQIIWF